MSCNAHRASGDVGRLPALVPLHCRVADLPAYYIFVSLNPVVGSCKRIKRGQAKDELAPAPQCQPLPHCRQLWARPVSKLLRQLSPNLRRLRLRPPPLQAPPALPLCGCRVAARQRGAKGRTACRRHLGKAAFEQQVALGATGLGQFLPPWLALNLAWPDKARCGPLIPVLIGSSCDRHGRRTEGEAGD